MKFYGNGYVWDGENNKMLCQFVDGEFETEDDRVIEKLKSLGYKVDEVIENTIDKTDDIIISDNTEYDSMSFGELKKMAAEKGINTYKMNKQNIIDSILNNKG